MRDFQYVVLDIETAMQSIEKYNLTTLFNLSNSATAAVLKKCCAFLKTQDNTKSCFQKLPGYTNTLTKKSLTHLKEEIFLLIVACEMAYQQCKKKQQKTSPVFIPLLTYQLVKEIHKLRHGPRDGLETHPGHEIDFVSIRKSKIQNQERSHSRA